MSMIATYSPEDNKIRIYPEGTRVDSVLDADEYADFKRAGYKWAAKQECFVCPRWTPRAEDWALELCGEIGDEDYSPEERSADRAERFSGYRDKRRSEAGVNADAFEAGPSVFGHQNRARAERQARRHDRFRSYAVTQWGKAEYWQERTAGVIRHALHRSSAKVRRGRLLRLEADQRKHEKEFDGARQRYADWQEVLQMDGADSLEKETPAYGRAYRLVNYGCHGRYHHPRREPDASKYNDGKTSLYSLLTDEKDPLTPKECAEVFLAHCKDPSREGGYFVRWSQHYSLRVGYEKAMLENEGGMAADVEMEVGGFVGRHQIQKVNKSRATGRVVSVTVLAQDPYWRGEGPAPLKPTILNIERCGEDVYRAPTDEERAAFEAGKKAAKAKHKPIPQINPTDEDAQRLQALWNSRGKGDGSEVWAMTQAKFSYYSKGDMCQMLGLDADGKRASRSGKPVVCKVRVAWRTYSDSVIVLTDKPRKPLPLDWEAIEAAQAEKVNA